MSNAKTTNIPPHLHGIIERSIAKNTHTTLLDTVITPLKIDEKVAEKYLKKQRERAAIERLPRFEQTTATDIERLRGEVQRLHHLIALVMVILLTIALLGGTLCLL